MLMLLLSVHVTSVLFLVWFNNFAYCLWASIGVTHSYSSHVFLCTLERAVTVYALLCFMVQQKVE